MKILLTLGIIVIILIPTLFGLHRYSNNQESIIPYPLSFRADTYQNITADAPILIIGDRLGDRLASFKKRLSEKLSLNLSKPIKIASLTNEGDSIHRSLEKIKKLKRMPLIIIYIGSTDQNYEYIFETKSLRKIEQNFELYQNDLIKTALMVFPVLSRLVYWPIAYTELTSKVDIDENKYSDSIYQLRMKIHYILYAAALDEFFSLSKRSNSLLIPITTPLNLETPPRKSCYGTLTGSADKDIKKLKQLINKKDYKTAFNLSKELALINSTNAEILYLHGQVLKNLNRYKAAQNYHEMAIAYDCANNRGNPIFNVILRRVSKKHNYSLFDFHQYLVDESQDNFTFIDEVFPQDIYMEKLTDLLAQRIKKRLKL